MKLVLIQPSHHVGGREIHKSKRAWMPRLTLPLLAALTPPDVEVSIVDEYVDEVDFDREVDLVGITAMTLQATRAYQIADCFRRRGVRVVMGGHHVSVFPEEAIQHCDAVVIGEAEEVWPTVIEDLAGGRAKPFYQGDGHPNLQGLPVPRLSLLPLEVYFLPYRPVQTMRGCPYGCDFCAVTSFFGGTLRLRPVEEVVRDVREAGSRWIIFVDDNIAVHPRHARELFQALIPLGIRWVSQGNISIGWEAELLELAARSGCVSLLIGIESTSRRKLQLMGKPFNRPERYQEALRNIRAAGILVLATMIVGLDEDDETVFDETVQFLERNRVPLAFFSIYTPLPGTRARARLQEQGRIMDGDWSRYDFAHAVFQPKQLSPQALEEGYWRAFQQFYSIPSMVKRLLFPPQPKLRLALTGNLLCRYGVKHRSHPLFG
ncbi:MAG: B12-binding domain-containing radical SAM protein [Anaerolineae bacterium]